MKNLIIFTPVKIARTTLAAFTALVIAAAMVVSIAPQAWANSANQSRVSKSKQSVRSELPMTIVVSLSKQRLVAYRGTKIVAQSRISSGKRGHRTPKGVFTILQKRKRHYSNLYANAPMPFMQRVTWSGIALHAGHIPGYPASHGCIRLPYSFARKLFSMTSMADRVIITDGRPEPRTIAHDVLIKPLPPGNGTQVASLELPVGEDGAKSTTDVVAKSSTSSHRWLMGVSPANAASVYEDLEAQIKGPLTRTAVAAARRNHLTRLEKMSADTKIWAKEAADKLKAANLKLRKLVKAPAKLRSERADLQKELNGLERAKHAIEREMRDFMLANQQLNASAPSSVAEQSLSTTKRALVQTASLDAASLNAADSLEASRLAKNKVTAAARPGSPAPLTPTRPDAATIDPASLEMELEARLIAKYDEMDATTEAIDKLSETLARHEETVKAEMLRREILKQRYTTASQHHLRIARELKEAERAQERYEKPITVLISRKKQKLYVRQDQDDILEAAVKFENPDSPVGTHVFTATGYTPGETDLNWKTITPAKGAARIKRKKGMSRKEWRSLQAQANKKAGNQTPERALSRVQIPEDVRTRLSELIKPGSSIVISDNGKSLETGKYTDLIVQF
ncbi:MAG: L,D-transpeptidase family protein [Pseudomonadota bacterium]